MLYEVVAQDILYEFHYFLFLQDALAHPLHPGMTMVIGPTLAFSPVTMQWVNKNVTALRALLEALKLFLLISFCASSEKIIEPNS